MLRRLGIVGLILALLHLATFTAAWPWPVEDIGGIILRRADPKSAAQTSNGAKATPAQKAKASASATDKQKGAKGTTGPASASATASASGSASASGTRDSKASGGAKKTKAAASKTKAAASSSIDNRLPAGMANMLTPAATAMTTYYKVGQKVTFGWNYTSLSNEPKAVDVFVTCGANEATYTISNNMTFHSSAKVIWDTKPEESGANPLLTDKYTLIIHDAAKDVSQAAAAGNLGPYSQLQFGMYTPQPYQGLDEGWKCAVCSGAISDLERQALSFMFGMCVITILSFTWFVGGAGLLS